jgi:hypothetical protein
MGLRALFAFAVVFAASAHADESSLRAHPPGPLEMASSDDGRRVMGEIHGLLPYRFEAAAAALKDPSSWCEILLLHLDTKECRVVRGPASTDLQAGVVTHYDQPASSAYRVQFRYRLVRDTHDYIEAILEAEDGPIDTRDFRILFEGVRTPQGRMFAHMAYSYTYGAFSHIALGLYLATFGRGKVGFTVVGHDAEGNPKHVGGMRGVVERNTMRYSLAVEAWLGASGATREQRMERALRNWYASVERYPRQLHELSESDYLSMKRRELGLPP